METPIIHAAVSILMVFFLLMVMNFQFLAARFTDTFMLDTMNHANVEVMRLLIRQEINKIGENIAQKSTAIINADSHRLQYLFAASADSDPDTISILLDQSQSINGTYIPLIERERMSDGTSEIKSIIKTVNSVNENFGYIGANRLEFRYFDRNGIETNTPSNIRFIGYKLQLRAMEKVGEDYQMITIEDRILIKNIWTF